MRAHAAAFLADVEARPDSAETGVAHRVQGITHWFAGEFLEARQHLERALALFQPGRDDDLSFRFGQDAGATAMTFLAFASWPLREIDRATSLVERMRARVGGLTHANTLAFGAIRERRQGRKISSVHALSPVGAPGAAVIPAPGRAVGYSCTVGPTRPRRRRK